MLLTERTRQVLWLALPIIGGMASQNVLNLVDTLMVGRLGDAALGAVGVGGFANFVCVSMIAGLSAGVQAMAARRLGEGKTDQTALPLNGGLLVAFLVGLPLGLLLSTLTPTFFPWLVEQPDIAQAGIPYLQARLAVLAAIGMNFAFRGYWNAVNLSRIYFRTLVVTHSLNIVLNYLLIFGKAGLPELGVAGAGVASAIATVAGTVLYVIQGAVRARTAGFLNRLPERAALGTLLRVSLPASFQQLFLSAGLTVFFVLIGRVGKAELAASNVLVNLLLVAVLPGIGFGLAAASLVGQALGRRQVEEAKAWGWEVARVCLVGVMLLTVPGALAPDLLLSAFLTNPATLEMARAPLRLLALVLPLDAVGLVFLQALNGAGDTRTVLLVAATLQWGLLLPAVYLVGPYLGWGLMAIWLCQCGYRLLQAGILAVLWQRGHWAKISL